MDEHQLAHGGRIQELRHDGVYSHQDLAVGKTVAAFPRACLD